MRFCISLLLLCEIVSFVRFCTSLCSLAGRVELLPLLEEPAFEFELCVRWSLVRILFITWLVLSPLCLFLRSSCDFVSVTSSRCLVLWDWDFASSRSFLPFHLAFGSLGRSLVCFIFYIFNYQICAVCCQCTNQGGDWGPAVVTPGVMSDWCWVFWHHE